MGIPKIKNDQIYTYGDYATWPDDERWELIDGVAWNMSPAPATRHQRISRKLSTEIDTFLKDKTCEVFAAPFDVTFPDFAGQEESDIRTVVQPDLSVICDPDKLTEKGCTGAPDLVIEILSPYTSKKDLNEKFRLYEREGVREYWIIDHESRYVQVFLLNDKGTYDEGTIIPPAFLKNDESDKIVNSFVLREFSVNLNDLFIE
ncbi:MAG: Uma2 family endonuclease [Spirochaetales bacterium]|nr:Uma2 family endonuclease [Spirochaetales bacterium]